MFCKLYKTSVIFRFLPESSGMSELVLSSKHLKFSVEKRKFFFSKLQQMFLQSIVCGTGYILIHKNYNMLKICISCMTNKLNYSMIISTEV